MKWCMLVAVALVLGSSSGSTEEWAVQRVPAADGAGLRVVSAGKISKPGGVLLVPGWTMTAEIWRGQIDHLASRHRVVAMDPRGQGESDKVRDGLYPAARARDIRAVVEALSLEPVVLVGWSMGVPEVLSYVEQFGTSGVAALVLVDGIAGGDFDPVMTPAWLKWAASLQRQRRTMTEGFVASMFATPQPPEFLAALVETSLTTPTDSAMALFLGTMFSDLRPVLPTLDRPTVLAVAPGPFMPVYQQMARAIPGCRLEVFSDAGHALFVDRPQRFNALLDEVLAGLEATTPK